MIQLLPTDLTPFRMHLPNNPPHPDLRHRNMPSEPERPTLDTQRFSKTRNPFDLTAQRATTIRPFPLHDDMYVERQAGRQHERGAICLHSFHLEDQNGALDSHDGLCNYGRLARRTGMI